MANPRLLSDQAFATASGLPGLAAVLAKLCLEHPVHPTTALLKEVEFQPRDEDGDCWGELESDDDPQEIELEGPGPLFPARRACSVCHQFPPGYYAWPLDLPDPPPFVHEPWGPDSTWGLDGEHKRGEDMVCYACVQAEAKRRGYTMEPHEELGGGILMLSPRTGCGIGVEEKPHSTSELEECLEHCLSCPGCDPPSTETRKTLCYRCLHPEWH
jgi:hypothetical protein